MRLVYILALLLATFTVQGEELTADSKKAVAGYNAIVHDASLPGNQLYFIACFPGTKDKFIRTFGPNSYDQLYTQYREYMAAYKKFGAMYPKVALPKAMDIGKGLVWSGGPVGELHDILLTLATDNPSMFADSLAVLKKKEQNAIILFMADTITPEPLPQFQQLLAALDKIDRAELRRRFEDAYQQQRQYHNEHDGK